MTRFCLLLRRLWLNKDYSNKIETLQDIFGTDDIILEKQNIIVNGHSYPVVDDVIILLDPSQYPSSVSRLLNSSPDISKKITTDFAEDIQFTFGAEWLTYPDIMPEHEDEFALYFDLINILDLKDARVCDLGCGIGRWSHFLKDKCRELILLDFSEAIFAARKNLKESENKISTKKLQSCQFVLGDDISRSKILGRALHFPLCGATTRICSPLNTLVHVIDEAYFTIKI